MSDELLLPILPSFLLAAFLIGLQKEKVWPLQGTCNTINGTSIKWCHPTAVRKKREREVCTSTGDAQDTLLNMKSDETLMLYATSCPGEKRTETNSRQQGRQGTGRRVQCFGNL